MENSYKIHKNQLSKFKKHNTSVLQHKTFVILLRLFNYEIYNLWNKLDVMAKKEALFGFSAIKCIRINYQKLKGMSRR